MYVDGALYEAHVYSGNALSTTYSNQADPRRDTDAIAVLREFVEPCDDLPTGYLRYADLFYHDDGGVTLLGTWVSMDGETTWHAGGWAERPSPSKEQSLRYLHGLGRPA